VRLDAGPGEDVRLDQVVPGGVAAEVRDLRETPLGLRGVAGEGRPRLVQRFDDLAVRSSDVTRFVDLSKRTVRPVDSWNWRKYCFWMLASTVVTSTTSE
jgi:hypothetical protein